MSAFFGIIGMLGFFVTIGILIVKLIQKKPKRNTFIAMGAFFVSFIIGVSLPSPPESVTASITQSSQIAVQSSQSETQSIGQNIPSQQPTQSSERELPKTSTEGSESVQSEVEAYTDDFKHRVRTVLKYHTDKTSGAISDAEAAGQWLAFELNAGLYKTNYGITSLEHRVYYYAVYGENEYLDEFGYNEEFIDDVKKYISELS